MTDDRYSEQQPYPIECNISVKAGITAIARAWKPGDTSKCRLCEVCTARGNLCVVQTSRDVDDEAAWLFSWRGPPGAVAAGGLRIAAR
jgi:hypothetical protein